MLSVLGESGGKILRGTAVLKVLLPPLLTILL